MINSGKLFKGRGEGVLLSASKYSLILALVFGFLHILWKIEYWALSSCRCLVVLQ